MSRPACAAATQRAGIGTRHQHPFNGIAFACMAALGRPCRRITHAQSFGINKPSLATSPNSKALPRRHIDAVLDRRSQLALGRRNWLFVGSQQAGERAGVVLSLIESAKLNGHDPWAYLKDVFERLPTLKNRDLAKFLPHNWRASATGIAVEPHGAPLDAVAA